MRGFIFTKVERFQTDSITEEIEEIKDAFDQYLDNYPAKSSRSKHGIMGPVGKILQEIKKGNWDAEGLSGYAINVHLHNPKTKGWISENARGYLEEGIEKLLALIRREPVTAQDRILELVDYGLYYRRRKKGIAWLEAVKKEWAEFLKTKYVTSEDLFKAWGEKPKKGQQGFESIGYPGKTTYENAKGQKKKDMGEFIKQTALKGYNLEDEEESN